MTEVLALAPHELALLQAAVLLLTALVQVRCHFLALDQRLVLLLPGQQAQAFLQHAVERGGGWSGVLQLLPLLRLPQAFNLRPLVQRYSDTSLTGWHQIKHGLVGMALLHCLLTRRHTVGRRRGTGCSRGWPGR